jgi:hypothetical protein
MDMLHQHGGRGRTWHGGSGQELNYLRFPPPLGSLRSRRFSAASTPGPRPVPALVLPVDPPRSKPGRSTSPGSAELPAALSPGLSGLFLAPGFFFFGVGVLVCFSTMILLLDGYLLRGSGGTHLLLITCADGVRALDMTALAEGRLKNMLQLPDGA